jgi:hypothetical protein
MTKSWRDVLPIHPAAELFPLMSPGELRALGEDIKTKSCTNQSRSNFQTQKARSEAP